MLKRLTVIVATLLLTVSFSQMAPAAALEEDNVPEVARWDRFEHVFNSSIEYQQPYASVELTVTLTSPTGDSRTVRGFWDGEQVWRVRFAPDATGRWKFNSVCSDEENKGLHGITGEFRCTDATGKTRFGQHGPIRRSRDGVHFEHADGTPFLWLADTVWRGGIGSTEADWRYYVEKRAGQGFTAAQWIALSETDSSKRSPFIGESSKSVDPAYFQRLDQKVEMLNGAGLLSAIVPFQQFDKQNLSLLDVFSEKESIRLLQYLNARWGANQVAWILPCGVSEQDERIAAWRRIGKATFADDPDTLVILDPGETYRVAKDLRTEGWVDAIGYQTGRSQSEEGLRWMFSGPFTQEWRDATPLPVLNLAPAFESRFADSADKPASSDEVRRILYTSLFSVPPAGVSYGAEGVWDWKTVAQSDEESSNGTTTPEWKRALFLPAAQQMTNLVSAFGQFDWWRLRPAPDIVTKQPGLIDPKRYVAGARSKEGDLTVVYVPEDRTIEISIDALPPSPNITWLNPRTGKSSPAVAVVGDRSCQFPTPEPGDWLLLMKSQKQ